MRRFIFLTLFCGWLAAQPQPKSASPPPSPTTPEITQPKGDDDVRFYSKVTNILAPTKVFDPDGNMINNVRGDQFHLYDNGKEQNIRVDEAFIPISMVIAIQCNGEVDQILPKVNKIGNMIAPLMLGTLGEAAVVAFDHRIRVMQDFTSDPDKITDAVKKIHTGSMSAALIDAVDASEHMLRHRPKDHQKIILLISETRDSGSINRGRETLHNLQIGNVAVYQVTMSRVLGKLTAPPADPRPDPLPPAMHPMPSNVPATPTTVMQTYGTEGARIEFLPLFVEIFRDAKAIFKAPPAEVFVKGTGGAQFGFYRGRGLEDAIQEMGGELHSQYMLSYSPNNKGEGGWHTINVEVSGHGPRIVAKTRPGYWMAADFRN
jgi:VWFA-related protein